MFKAFTGALSLALALLVLNWLLPEVVALLVSALTKILILANLGLDQALQNVPQ